MEYVEGYVMASLPDGTNLLVPWEEAGFLECVRVYDPNVLVHGDPSSSDNTMGSIGDENGNQYPFGVLTVDGPFVRIFHDIYESCWIDSRHCETICKRMHHRDCQTPHAFYLLNPELPNEAQVAVRDFSAKEADCVGRLEHGQIVEVHYKSENWLQMCMSKSQTFWLMERTDTVQLLVEAQDHRSPQCDLISMEGKWSHPQSEPSQSDTVVSMSEIENTVDDTTKSITLLKCKQQPTESGKEEFEKAEDASNENDLRESEPNNVQTQSNAVDDARSDSIHTTICCAVVEEVTHESPSEGGENCDQCEMHDLESVIDDQATPNNVERGEIDEEDEDLMEQIHEMEVSINEIEIDLSQSDDDINMDGDESVEASGGNEFTEADEKPGNSDNLNVTNEQSASVWDWDERPLTGTKAMYGADLPAEAYDIQGVEDDTNKLGNEGCPKSAIGSTLAVKAILRSSECCTEEASTSTTSPSSSLLLPVLSEREYSPHSVFHDSSIPQVMVETAEECIGTAQQNNVSNNLDIQTIAEACENAQLSRVDESVPNANATSEKSNESVTIPQTEHELECQYGRTDLSLSLDAHKVNSDTAKGLEHPLKLQVSTPAESDEPVRALSQDYHAASKMDEVEVNRTSVPEFQDQVLDQTWELKPGRDTDKILGDPETECDGAQHENTSNSKKVEGSTYALAQYSQELDESGETTEDEAWMQNITDDEIPLLEEDLQSIESIKSAASAPFQNDLRATQEDVEHVDTAIGDISIEEEGPLPKALDAAQVTNQLRGLDYLKQYGVKEFCHERLNLLGKNTNHEAFQAAQAVINATTGDDLLEQMDTMEADSYTSPVKNLFFPPNVDHVVPYSADALLDVLYSRVSKEPIVTAKNGRNPQFCHSDGPTRKSAFQKLMKRKKEQWSREHESETADSGRSVFHMIMDDADPIDLLKAECDGVDVLMQDDFSLLRSFEYHKPKTTKNRVQELQKERSDVCRPTSFSSPDMKTLLRSKTLKRAACAISKTPPLSGKSNKSKIDPLDDSSTGRNTLSLNQRLWADLPKKPASTSSLQAERPPAASSSNPHYKYSASVSSATSLMSERCKNILVKRANTAEHLQAGSGTLRRSFLQKPSATSSLRTLRSESQMDQGYARLSLPSRSKLELARSSAVANVTRFNVSKR
ncbi:unnamed protein product [Albugo candida]|nr:unnamed protein product [Albugo candida]|eukprot:CCI39865.1 unnamed protein product [Albugo candida]